MAHGSPNTIQVVLVGDIGVGKSSLLHRLKTGKFVGGRTPSLGYDNYTKSVSDGEGDIKLVVWDTAGMERYRTLTHTYFGKAHAVVMVYSVDESETLAHLRAWKRTAMEHVDNVLWAVVGNKSDLRTSMSRDVIHAFLVDNQCHCAFRVSAKTGENVDTTFAKIARKTSACIRNQWRDELTLSMDPYTDSTHRTLVMESKPPSWFSVNIPCCVLL